MNIADACSTVHQWQALLAPDSTARPTPGDLGEAVAELKRFLEHERGDGLSMRELDVAESQLMTRHGVRALMPFVLSAETLCAAQQRRGRNPATGAIATRTP